MKHFKKALAMITVIALLASICIVPVLADGFRYEAEAEVLNELKLMEGMGLGDRVNRLQGLIFAIKAAGKKDEVDNMSDWEVERILANVVDADQIPDWGRKWTAYAVANGYTTGVDASILPKVKFAPLQEVSGTSFLVWILKIGMGYKDVGTRDAVSVAIEAGVLTLSQAMEIGPKSALIRDDAAGVLYGACKNGVCADGRTFIQSLIDAGFISESDAIAAGFIKPAPAPTPKNFEIKGATALNLVQVKVVFNQDVDEVSAEKKSNYSIGKVTIKDVQLQDDGQAVILTFEAKDARKQQDKLDLTVQGVKSTKGEEIKKTTIEDIEFIDVTIPEVLDAEVVGSSTIKVVFSEPMDPDTVTKNNFSVNNGRLYIKDVKLQNNYTEAFVELYSALKDDSVTIQVKSGNEDFAGFGVVGKTMTIPVIADKAAPEVIGYEKASMGGVTLIWSEDIQFNGTLDKNDYYHTNQKNPASSVEIDGNKMTIVFDVEDNPMPETAYVYVMKEAVKDGWGNKNTQQMIKVEYEPDNDRPEVEGIEVKSATRIVITFSEDLNASSAKNKNNYTLLDDDDDEVKNIISTVDYSDRKVTIDFKKELDGDYSIVIKGVKDISGNEIKKVTIPFTVEDMTRPDPDDFTAKLYNAGDVGQLLRINFGEKMATSGKYSIDDLEKYSIDGYILADIEGVELEVIDDSEGVEIRIPSEEDLIEDGVKKENRKRGVNFLDVSRNSKLSITRVADAAGNYMLEAEAIIDLDADAYVEIEKVEATALDTVVITLKGELAYIDTDDLFITEDATLDIRSGKIRSKAIEIAGFDMETKKDGKTVITITLAEDLTYDLDPAIYLFIVGDASENRYGETLRKDLNKAYRVVDRISPVLYDDDDRDTPTKSQRSQGWLEDYLHVDENAGIISIVFSESLKNIGSKELALAGNDLVIEADGDTLVNGIDFYILDIVKTYKPYDTVRIKLTGDYRDFEGDIEIYGADKRYYLRDGSDNVIEDFEIDEFEVVF